jgi:salicylate hydroxylase
VFTGDATPEQVPELLDIYNQVRYDHTVTICITSRVSHERRMEVLDDLRRFVPNATLDEDLSHIAFAAWNSYPVREVERLLALRHGEKAL